MHKTSLRTCRIIVAAKRMILALVALTVATAVFGGGTQQTSKAQQDSKTSSGKDPLAKFMPVEGKKYVISWLSNASSFTDENGEMIKYWNDKFNVEIKIINLESSKQEELMNLRIATGDIPDKFFCKTLPTLSKWAGQDVLADIPEDLVKRLWPVSYELCTDSLSNYFNMGKVDGKIYGFRNFHAPQMFRGLLAWRKDWLKNVGIDKIPSTLDEAEQAFYKFRNEDPDKNGKKDTYAFSNDGIVSIFGAYGLTPGTLQKASRTVGGPWIVRDGKAVHSAVQPDMKEALSKMAQWYKDGLIDPEFITGENTGGDGNLSHSFVKGKIGISGRQTWYVWMPAAVKGGYQGINYTELEKIYKDKVKDVLGHGGPLAVPGKNSGLPQGFACNPASIVFGKPMLEKEPDKLGKILSMMEYWQSVPENIRTATMGIKGKHWDMFDGNPGYIPPYNNVPDICKIGGQGSMTFLTIPKLYYQVIDVGLDKLAIASGCDKGGLINAVNVVIPSEAKFGAELQKLYEDMLISIITNGKPISYFDQFVDQWNKIGGDVISKEANEIYQKTK